MFRKSQYRLAKSYRVGIFCFLVLCIMFEVALLLLPSLYQEDLKVSMIPKEIQDLNRATSDSPIIPLKKLFLFNPNNLSQQEWKEIGLSDKQIKTLFNYKTAIDGFKSKAQFKKCYAISEEFYTDIEPYIDLPENTSSNNNSVNSNKTKIEKEGSKPKISYSKFNPNEYSKADWVAIGFSPKQAQTILNYKNKFLGGSFSRVEELQKCYAISEEKYAEIKPFIILPSGPEKERLVPHSKIEKEDKENTSTNIELKPFKINDLDEKGWENLGFTPKQVKTIMKYKYYCGGEFTSLEQFKKCYVVSEEKFEALKPYILFE